MTIHDSGSSGPATRWKRLAVMVGVVAYLGTGYLYLAFSGLVAIPGLWAVPLWAAWVGGLCLVARFARRWSWWVMAAGPLAIAVWWVYATVGWGPLGWSR